MASVSAVAAHVDFPRGRLQQERSPQRLIGRQPAAGEVARGETADGESVAERLLFVPVQLDDLRRVEAPVLEVLAHAQRTDDRADALFQFADRAVVEMIPVVVRDDEVVDVGHLFGAVDVGAFERTVEQRERRRAAENRIDERPASFGLNQVGRVPEPDQQVAFGIERPQVGADRRYRILGTESLALAEEKFQYAAQTALVARHHRTGFLIAEPAVAVVRRLPDAFEPFALGQTPEARQTDDDECGGQRREQDA